MYLLVNLYVHYIGMHIYLYRMLTISLGFCNNKVVFRGCDVCWRWIIYFRDFCTPYWAIAAVASYFWALCGTHLQHLFSSWAEGGVRLDTHHIQVCAPPEGRLCKCLRELSMDEAVTSQDRMIISLANVTFRFFFFSNKRLSHLQFLGLSNINRLLHIKKKSSSSCNSEVV